MVSVHVLSLQKWCVNFREVAILNALWILANFHSIFVCLFLFLFIETAFLYVTSLVILELTL